MKSFLIQSNLAQISEIENLGVCDLSKLFAELKTSPAGLDLKEARSRLKRYGPNQISAIDSESSLRQLAKMVFAPLPVLLMILSGISFLTGERAGALVIAIMIVLSIFLTFIQERKSNRAAEKLKALVAIQASVLRNGSLIEVNVKDIVPGDIIHLSAGDIVPGDIRLIASRDLFTNEAALTGESLPVEKNCIPSQSVKPEYTCNNLCFMGTHVVSGSAQGVVLRTGAKTFFGQLAIDITAQSKYTSFDQGIQKYIWLMMRFMFVMVPAIFFINGFIKGDWLEAGLFAVALAVGLTPEMLPMLVTINLAKGALAMSKKRVIVKRLNAIQNLGGMDVLCADKTGTLTQDRIILESHVDVFGNPSQQVLEFAYLNSRYQSSLKNLLDLAVLEHVEIHEKLHSVDTYTKVDEIPFDFERRRMTVVVEKNASSHILICKGAVEEIFACCQYAQTNRELIPLDDTHRHILNTTVAQLNNQGYRVIAVATKEVDATGNHYSISDESNMVLLGYIAFLDPPKDSAKSAIEQLIGCGVQVKILTGDNELITRKVCHDVGLKIDELVLGNTIESMTDQQLAVIAQSTTVFAKMTPHQKLRVIKALQSNGHVVGYLGDGINDGPSLRVADVSISVDTAVDIAKESADIILLEKNLRILHQGVLEGRRVFGNLMKYLKIASSSNLGNTLSMLGASLLFPFLPMAPVQILVNDLLYDLSQSAVPTDHIDEDYLAKPKAWDMRSIAHYMFIIGPISSIFDYLLFAYMWFVLMANSVEFTSIFQTGWFIESLLSQLLIVHILRTAKIPFVQSTASPTLLLSTIVIALVGIMLPYTDLGGILNMTTLPPTYWVGLVILLSGYLLITQVVKALLIKRFGYI